MKKTITLVNTGNVMTHFRLRSATGDEPTKTTFDWTFGKIKPGSKCDLTAEILTDGCDIIEEKFDIHVTNSKKDQEKIYSIWSKAKIMEEELVIRLGFTQRASIPPLKEFKVFMAKTIKSDQNGNMIDTLNYGDLYNMTKRSKTMFLVNKSPQPIRWVSVHLNGTVGSELGSFKKVSDLIKIEPPEGTLDSKERKEIKIIFNPKKTIGKIEEIVTFAQGGFVFTL